MKALLAILTVMMCCAPINLSLMEQAPTIKKDSAMAVKSIPREIVECPVNENKYLPALNRLERKYQARCLQTHERYEFFPIQMYPFFCLKQEESLRLCPPGAKMIVLRDKKVYLKEYVQDKTTHIQVAVLIRTRGKTPRARVYTMHSMVLDSNSIWREDQKPIVVTTILTGSGTYYVPK